MIYENIEFNYNNFCIGSLIDTYCSIDTTNPTAVLQVKTNTGQSQGNYSLNPTITQGVSIKSLEYPGPRDTSTHADGMPFWTLERENDTQCTIKQWELNDTLNRLDLVKTVSKTTGDGYYFDVYDLSLEYYQIGFDGATTLNSGKIKVDDTSNIDTGDTLYLGLSSHSSYLGDFETAEVTSVSGSWLYITASGTTPPDSIYNNGDIISSVKSMFLFSNASSDGNKGSLIKLDVNGNILDSQESGLYYGVTASAFNWAYAGTIGFVKGNNILYMAIGDYELQKSVAITNYRADKVTPIIVHDIAFNSTSAFRLQSRTMRRGDDGSKTDYNWSTYNFQQDGIAQYPDSITMWAEPAVIPNWQGGSSTTVYALVRNQYGGVLSGRTVYFDKTSGDANGSFDDPNKQADTNASGIASIGYTAGWYDPSVADDCCEDIYITGYTDGSNVLTGSQYIWDAVELTFYKKFIGQLVYFVQLETTSGTCPTEGSDLYSETHIEQLEEFTSMLYAPNLSKFQFPGGHWTETGAPTEEVSSIEQLDTFESEATMGQIDNEFQNVMPIEQLKDKTNTGQLSQTYISRHLTSGHKDTAEIAQFRFIIEARPAFWSEKNSVATDIWIKLAPYGFDLNQSTLIFRVREISYAGDTGWINYAGTPYISVSTWDAGGGLLGLEININPPQNFHHNGMVYVYIEVYDQASTPNIIIVDYWFKIVPDFKGPYIINEDPGREEIDVAIDTNIEFDIIDEGVGTDISTLEFYVDNRMKIPTVSGTPANYHVYFNPAENFYFGQTVEITVKAKDASDYENTLYDMWRFYMPGSTGPWFDTDSFLPKICSKGVYRKYYPVSFNVYEIDGTGIDQSSILVHIGGKERNVTLTPIIYRLN